LRRWIGIEVEALNKREHDAFKVDIVKAMDENLEACACNPRQAEAEAEDLFVAGSQ